MFLECWKIYPPMFTEIYVPPTDHQPSLRSAPVASRSYVLRSHLSKNVSRLPPPQTSLPTPFVHAPMTVTAPKTVTKRKPISCPAPVRASNTVNNHSQRSGLTGKNRKKRRVLHTSPCFHQLPMWQVEDILRCKKVGDEEVFLTKWFAFPDLDWVHRDQFLSPCKPDLDRLSKIMQEDL